MSRKIKKRIVGKRVPDEAKKAVFHSIDELQYLNAGYDDGKLHLARTMAQTIDRLVRAELFQTGLSV